MAINIKRILIVHNHYGDRAVGGEAMVVYAEADLLRDFGHHVHVYERSNAEIADRGIFGKIKAFTNIGWSMEGYRSIYEEICNFRPDIIHVHNYKYLLSPSIFGAAKDLGVPTVLTLHNYRLACPAGQFLRNGHVCEDCLHRSPYRMLWHRCSSRNIVKNISQFYLYWSTRRRKLLSPWVDAYIALSDFAKSRFVAAGLPGNKVFVKPNFIKFSNNCIRGKDKSNDSAIFVGRLSREKGIEVLIDAWQDIDYPLNIIGDGPLFDILNLRVAPHIKFLGALSHNEVFRKISNSNFLILPSICYEGCPMTLLEAMALGKPVIASDLGPRSEMIINGYNGLLYNSKDSDDLKQKIQILIKDHKICLEMGENAKKEFLTKYSPEINYKSLIDIYSTVVYRNTKNQSK